MKACGVICEYNPFHYGHAYHLHKSREITGCDVMICAMSGNFVQRGEPAITDKWSRVKTALQHGADLIIELPFAYATQSARYFAKGAVTSLARAHVSDIVFGSECGDIDRLIQLATHHDHPDHFKKSVSVPKTYEKLYGTHLPNDILGINYIKEMKPYDITPHCIQRTNRYHDRHLTKKFASANALRDALFDNKDISVYTPMYDILAKHALDDYYRYIQGLLFSLPKAYLQSLFLMDEGIEQRLITAAKQCNSLNAFLESVTCKRYTTSRIRRTLIHLLNQTTKTEINALPSLAHIRVLGFNSVGQRYLKTLKEHEEVRVAMKFTQVPLPYRSMELRSAYMYDFMNPNDHAVEKEKGSPIRV